MVGIHGEAVVTYNDERGGGENNNEENTDKVNHCVMWLDVN